ncbi:bifunctional glutamate N-acetyltransferase/amino-acid acetyltransferase ArgJ [Enterococcus sp.]|uniref:bifunctional glutamate N-acetyltransferase/amino-acid acetyltransferase ArgJ n=1 Tax=Enterococcus sp. TaxID=35783 RepID=UPI002899C9BF|nr:bifunctional glutamate N-acetyltransferase/amino-acid acetyltransferase ArgJ [Enterococcus sp.]
MEKYCIPDGFSFYGKNTGIKKTNKDLGIVISDDICTAAAMFTKNKFCGESITVGKEVIANNHLQGIVVTSGVANVATGMQGKENAIKIINNIGNLFSIDPQNVLPSSTGIIGLQLPIEKIISGINTLTINSPGSVEDFAAAIMTTDTKLKIRTKKIGQSKILGVAKGSGMIEPNMATMLVYIFTDAKISQEKIYDCLKISVEKSFNSISIDTDTSTSDTVVLMTSNHYPVEQEEFQKKLDSICMELAMDILSDAEGATKIISVEVKGCNKQEDSKILAKSIVNSPLVKTAVYGADPNWGRIIMALGKDESINFSKQDVQIQIGNSMIFSNESCIVSPHELKGISDYIRESKTVQIVVSVGKGIYSSKVFGCDLTEDYVRINSLYST